MDSYDQFFRKLTTHWPHDWQRALAEDDFCSNRLIRIPTGFGKTHGVLAAWIWRRILWREDGWPRRLVWCLPMRVLVEQLEADVGMSLSRLGLLWDGTSSHSGKVGVHVLMGGADSSHWHLYPEESAVLIGTQDMLLSRAMNRGYGSPRARWPMEFGLLNHDALWVMDEVQLMDVGLATSAQLQAFRDDDAAASRFKRPCHTWWMSATLQQDWLNKSPDTEKMTGDLPATLRITEMGRIGHLWDDVTKPCRVERIKSMKELATLVTEKHLETGRDRRSLTLVVLNTVKSAVDVFDALAKEKSLKQTDVRLVHSRFRPIERAGWRDGFLNREACAPGTDRIIVTTQVVEAGVDISATLLITEIAPWASLVQRFGRCARWGGAAEVIIADLPAGLSRDAIDKARKALEKAKGASRKEIDESGVIENAESKAALPYSVDEIRAAREALSFLTDVSPRNLEQFEEQHPELLSRLYPYEPGNLLLRHELDELFDTASDLSGADIDISRFIRSGNERDVQVFWADFDVKTGPSEALRPCREALCSVPFFDAGTWLCGPGKNQRLLKKKTAWVWDWLDGKWREAEVRDIYPGQTILVHASYGGYDENRGWTGNPDDGNFPTVGLIPPDADVRADSGHDDESQSQTANWQTIAFHGRKVGLLTSEMARVLCRDYDVLFSLAGRLHDTGKSLPSFQNQIVSEERPQRQDIAKAPKSAWSGKRAHGYRHELGTVLGLFAVLRRHVPDHPALLGPWRELLTLAGMNPEILPPSTSLPTPIEAQLINLTAHDFNLLAYLVCAHHGKVRVSWHACKADRDAADGITRIRGIEDGAALPALPLCGADGEVSFLPEGVLDLSPSFAGLNNRTGQGWTERVLSLLAIHGPFGLAWMEAIIRAADQRASMADGEDPMLKEVIS